MTKRIKYIGLILGISLTISSFLFFARQQGTYNLMLLGGLLVSLVAYLAILFGKTSGKSKLIWSVVVVVAIAVQWLTQPILTKCSFLIYLNSNEKTLQAVNRILEHKQGYIAVVNGQINDRTGCLTPSEKDSLFTLRQLLDVYSISKTEDGVYYGLFGFLDVRIGIIYWIKSEMPDESYLPLKGNWYRSRKGI
jgi:hypothetical protein